MTGDPLIEQPPAEAYCIVVGPHIADDGHVVWALCCPHATVSTIDVESCFSSDYALGLFILLAQSELPPDELAAIEVRLLLGWTLSERAGCSCFERRFQVVSSVDGVRVEDLG